MSEKTVWVTYCGDHEEVDIDALRLVGVKKGQRIEVPADEAEGLLVQEDNWKKTTAPKSATAEEKE